VGFKKGNFFQQLSKPDAGSKDILNFQRLDKLASAAELTRTSTRLTIVIFAPQFCKL
jgi:hypothetical protein